MGNEKIARWLAVLRIPQCDEATIAQEDPYSYSTLAALIKQNAGELGNKKSLN